MTRLNVRTQGRDKYVITIAFDPLRLRPRKGLYQEGRVDESSEDMEAMTNAARRLGDLEGSLNCYIRYHTNDLRG